MIHRKNQSGFSIVEGIIVVVVLIGIVGLIGWRLYSQTGKQTSNSTTNNTSTSPSKESTSSTTTTTQLTYLDIKEWGVELPLPDNIKDAYYVVPTGMSKDPDGLPSGIILGVKSLDSSCGVVAADPTGYNNLLGGIVRVPPADKDPVSGKLYTEEDPNGVTIGDYYYGFADAVLKSKTCTSQTTIQSVDSAFAGATKGAVKTSTTQ